MGRGWRESRVPRHLGPKKKKMPPQANPADLIFNLAQGAGFDKIAAGIKKLAESGQNVPQIFDLPNLPQFLAGAGLKDMDNAKGALGEFMNMINPPPDPENQPPDPQKLSAALAMLTARLNPNNPMRGLTPPTGGPPSIGPQTGGLVLPGQPQGLPQGLPPLPGGPQGLPQGPLPPNIPV